MSIFYITMDELITIVRQVSPTSCLLACIESFNADHGKKITQQEMIQQLNGKLCNDEGFVKDNSTEAVMKKYNMEYQVRNNLQFPFEDKYDKELFWIIDPLKVESNYNIHLSRKKHVVRYYKKINMNEFLVMDPAKEDIQKWNEKGFKEIRCGVLVVKWINEFP